MKVRRSIFPRIRGYFLTGLVVTFPIGVTTYVTWWSVRFMDDFITRFIPSSYRDGADVWDVPGVGLLAAIILLIVIGWLAASFLGRFFVRLSERVIARMPIIRSLYAGMKQVFETIFARQSIVFRRAVLINFPHHTSWAIAFLTQRPPLAIRQVIEQDVYAVFMPTAPNPTSGYLIYVPKENVRLLDMSVEDAFKMIISGGLVSPDSPDSPDRPDSTDSPDRPDSNAS